MNKAKILKTESRLNGLNIAITQIEPNILSNDYPVLFLHGASFPTALAFNFKMGKKSWMEDLSEKGYEVYALDFLGYGNSDRYPEMKLSTLVGKPLGRALDVYLDVDKAVDFILQKTGKDKIYLIGHSWGGSVAALYATRFPDKIAKLVLFAGITVRKETTAMKNVELTYEEMTPTQRINAMMSLTPNHKESVMEKEVLETWGDVWLQSDDIAINAKSHKVRFPAGPSQDIEEMKHNKPYYDPKEIKTATLVIRGEWDQYPSGKDADFLFSNLTNTVSKKYIMLEGGTHVMHLEKSRGALYAEVLHFLQNKENDKPTNKHDIAVIFEVLPSGDNKQEYLDIAAKLKPELEKIEGFISIERYQSIYNPKKVLSLSFWKNEEAIKQWRNLEMHRIAQAKGREYIFKDYRIRIAQTVRDYGMFKRTEAPSDNKSYHGVKHD